MSTVDKITADKVIAGEYNDEVAMIVKYKNAWDGDSYGLVYHEADPLRYLIPTYYVKDPEILWINEAAWNSLAGKAFRSTVLARAIADFKAKQNTEAKPL